MPKIAFSNRYLLPLPKEHRFPIQKYLLVKEQLLYEGTIKEEDLFDPGLAPESEILRVHTKAYFDKVKHQGFTQKELRRLGLPQSEMLFYRSLSSTYGTLMAAKYALEEGISYNLAGGTHHAYADKAEGFSVFNDLAVTSKHLLAETTVKSILIVDLDVHQGNGTAVLFQDENRVFTFSMHGKDNYPLKKEQSDLDIAWPTGTTDDEYLSKLKELLPQLIDIQKPDFILYQGGVDVLGTDKLGKLYLTRQGCKERDAIVLNTAYQEGIPIVCTMGGGYSTRMVDIIEAHANTYRLGFDLWGWKN